MKKNLVAVVAATIVAGLLVSPADARPKKQKRPDGQRRYEVPTQTPSLDGRITGRLAPAGLKHFNTTDWGFPTDRIATEDARTGPPVLSALEFDGNVG